MQASRRLQSAPKGHPYSTLTRPEGVDLVNSSGQRNRTHASGGSGTSRRSPQVSSSAARHRTCASGGQMSSQSVPQHVEAMSFAI